MGAEYCQDARRASQTRLGRTPFLSKRDSPGPHLIVYHPLFLPSAPSFGFTDPWRTVPSIHKTLTSPRSVHHKRHCPYPIPSRVFYDNKSDMFVSTLLVLLPALSGLVSAAPSRKRGGCAHRPSLNQTQHLAAAPMNATTGDGILYGNHTWALNATNFGANPNDTDWKIYSELLSSLVANGTNLNGTTPLTNGTNTSSTTGGAYTVSMTELSSDQQAWIDAHNAARKQYGAEPVAWSNEAAAASKANFDANKVTCELAHTRTGFGQNLATGTGYAGSAQQAVDLWMSEAGESHVTTNDPC